MSQDLLSSFNSQTPQFASESEKFDQTNNSFVLPSIITQINEVFAVYDCSYNEKFLEWWRQTAWGKDTDAKAPGHASPAWGNKLRQTGNGAKYWTQFAEAALIRRHRIHGERGKPMLLCKHCSGALAHPTPNKAGNNGMKDHLASNACVKTQGPSTSQQILSFAKAVSQSIFITIYYHPNDI